MLDLVGQMFGTSAPPPSATAAAFSPSASDRSCSATNITIPDDVYHPLQAGAPFDGEGVPRKPRARWWRAASCSNIAYSRQAARLAGVEPTGHGFPLPNEMGEAPVNIVIAGGDATVEEMIASTERGILVTRLWYIREVDPYEKILTGMTRDGTFLIEDGQVRRPTQFPLQPEPDQSY